MWRGRSLNDPGAMLAGRAGQGQAGSRKVPGSGPATASRKQHQRYCCIALPFIILHLSPDMSTHSYAYLMASMASRPRCSDRAHM